MYCFSIFTNVKQSDYTGNLRWWLLGAESPFSPVPSHLSALRWHHSPSALQPHGAEIGNLPHCHAVFLALDNLDSYMVKPFVLKDSFNMEKLFWGLQQHSSFVQWEGNG